MKHTNPLTLMDFPDPDVIRVDDTYYMVTTTMHFMPGCVILRSYDLANWEFASYVYDELDGTPAQRMDNELNIYGQGMWAGSLRYHKGTFYVCFVANDTHKTYLFQSQQITGPWSRQTIDGFYHDCSLLFDDDDRIYIVYGNREVRLTELKSDLSGPKPGGLDRMIVRDRDDCILGYEGAHMYKINGRYYIFFIHANCGEWKRTQACFYSDSLNGEFVGGDVLCDDMGYCNQGVAQGGIVDTPAGDWYGILFQDRGAVGRIPVLVPIHWENQIPVFGIDNQAVLDVSVASTRPGYSYEPLYTNDDFHYQTDSSGHAQLKPQWQWNHIPNPEFWSVDGNSGTLYLHAGKVCSNITQAVNTLTQRTTYPGCDVIVTLDGSGLKDGDYAGLSAFMSCYGLIALTRQAGQQYLVMQGRPADNDSLSGMPADSSHGTEYARIPWNSSSVTLKMSVDFRNMNDLADFFYLENHEWKKLGISQKQYFKMDHFCGCRAALFNFATETTGGYAGFSNFQFLPHQQ